MDERDGGWFRFVAAEVVLVIRVQVIVLQSTWKSGNFRDALQYLRPNPFYMGIVRMLLEEQKVKLWRSCVGVVRMLLEKPWCGGPLRCGRCLCVWESIACTIHIAKESAPCVRDTAVGWICLLDILVEIGEKKEKDVHQEVRGRLLL